MMKKDSWLIKMNQEDCRSFGAAARMGSMAVAAAATASRSPRISTRTSPLATGTDIKANLEAVAPYRYVKDDWQRHDRAVLLSFFRQDVSEHQDRRRH